MARDPFARLRELQGDIGKTQIETRDLIKDQIPAATARWEAAQAEADKALGELLALQTKLVKCVTKATTAKAEMAAEAETVNAAMTGAARLQA